MNWQSFIAFNRLSTGSVPTGAIINGASSTAGGNITTGKRAVLPNFPWDTGPVCGNTTTINCFASPCPIMTVDRDLTTPSSCGTGPSVCNTHLHTPNLQLEIAYVGNHSGKLTGIRDINQPKVGSGWPHANIVTCNANLMAIQLQAGHPCTTSTTLSTTAPLVQVAAEVGPVH